MNQVHWKSYFIFSQKELKGIIVMGCILFLAVLLSLIFPSTKKTSVNNAKQVNAIHLFYFNTNTIDSASAIALGIPEKQVRSLLHYRAKGGYFKNALDFARLYGLSAHLYQTLKPYIQIQSFEKYDNKKITYRNQNSHESEANDWQLDINTANEAEWQQKSHLSTASVDRILAYKKYLGVFTKVSQISKVYGLTDSEYQNIRAHLKMHPMQNILPNAAALGFNEWKSIGLLSDRQIWTILKLKKDNGGHLSWLAIVEACDLTESEAKNLRNRVALSD